MVNIIIMNKYFNSLYNNDDDDDGVLIEVAAELFHIDSGV